MSTPAGWYYGELFSLIVPAAIITVVVSMGAKALAGEEHARTMDTLLVNPIKRSKIVVDKALAMVGITLLIALATFLGTAAGALIGGLDLSMSNIAAASTQAFGLGVFFGAVAIFGGAASGHTKIAAYGATGVALLGYVTNSFFSVSERLAEWARVSPFYYYTENQPLANGMSWGNLGILFLAGIVLVGMAVFLFERRDMRN
jgi:ABC-2 type transport system permease protein